MGSLAEADLEGMTHWSGLGYYSRARNLHQATCKICREHGGTLNYNNAANPCFKTSLSQ